VETRFFLPSRPNLGPTQRHVKWVTGSFPGGKVRPGRVADRSPPSSAVVMEEYSYTSTHPPGHTGPVTGSLYLISNFVQTFRDNLFKALGPLRWDHHSPRHNAEERRYSVKTFEIQLGNHFLPPHLSLTPVSFPFLLLISCLSHLFPNSDLPSH